MAKIHWLNPVNGNFSHGADWGGGVTPGKDDDALLDAAGSQSYTVKVTALTTVSAIETAANATLEVADGEIFTVTKGTADGVNAGHIVVEDNGRLSIGGTVDNTGSIFLNSVNTYVDFQVRSNLVLTGGGVVQFSDNSRNSLVQDSNTHVENVDNTFSGAGVIGDGYGFFMKNDSQGTIDASFSDNPLILGSDSNIAGPGSLSNAGVIESTGGAELEIGYISLSGSGGKISAGVGSSVLILNSKVTGQTLETAAGGSIAITGSRVKIAGTMSNAGTVKVTASHAVDGVTLTANAVLTGGGSLTLSNNANNFIKGSQAADVLTNADNTISGAGDLGDGVLTIVNDASGVIKANDLKPLTIDTGANTVSNAGLLEAINGGAMNVLSAVANSGTLVAMGGTLSVDGVVTGSGVGLIDDGTLSLADTFNENVEFNGTTGVLKLAQSQTYSALVMGFSSVGRTSFDLGDIGFAGAGEATFSGTASGGVLTVTDGTHTANINLEGDYLDATFVASSDGAGGTNVVAQSAQTPSPTHFASAMAAITGHGVAAGLIDARAVNEGRQMMLAAPRLAIA